MIAFGLLEAAAAGAAAVAGPAAVVGLAAAVGVAAGATVAGAVVACTCGTAGAAAPVVGGDVGATAVLGLHAASKPDAATSAPRRRRTCRRPMRNSGVIEAAP